MVGGALAPLRLARRNGKGVVETNSNSAGIPAPLLLSVLRFAGLVLAVLAGSVLGPQTALASFAGANGRIVFNSSRDGSACFPYCGEIYAMAPDGGGQTRLVNNPANDVDPAWSPSGQKIALRATAEARATST